MSRNSSNSALEYIASVKARANAATPGPWELYFATGEGPSIIRYRVDGKYHTYEEWVYPGDARPKNSHNTEFIAHARTDVERLVAMVELLSAALKDHTEESSGFYSGQCLGRADDARDTFAELDRIANHGYEK